MKEIGGYFELELSRRSEIYHHAAMALNTARNCLEYILKAKGYEKIFIPYYTCDVLLEPLNKLGVSYEFYHVNSILEPIFSKKLKEKEAFLITNYYGVKNDVVSKYAKLYPQQLIVDNSQAFYSSPIKGIDTFYSARKFFGLPDGAFLYTDSMEGYDDLDEDFSSDRMSHLLKRTEQPASEGYQEFSLNDKKLNNQSIKKMSSLTRALAETIDYENVKSVRQDNFKFLQDNLSELNLFSFDSNILSQVPLVYPFYTKDKELRARLIKNKIYVATYWPNVSEWVDSDSVEYDLMTSLLPLPIDQRYDREDLSRIVNLII